MAKHAVNEDMPTMGVNALSRMLADHQRRKGWKARSFGEEIALFHSELSEALEEHRDGRRLDEVYFNPDKPTKPEGIPIELADTVIRILAFCGAHDIDLEDAIDQKIAYNLTRPKRHGGKKL